MQNARRGAFPQGLKPNFSWLLMSELKLRPPGSVYEMASRNQKLESRNWKGEEKRDFIPRNSRDGAEVSLHRPTVSQERNGKKKSACSVRNDRVGWRQARERGESGFWRRMREG